MIVFGLVNNPQAESISYNLRLVADSCSERFLKISLTQAEWDNFSIGEFYDFGPEPEERIFFSTAPLHQFSFDDWSVIRSKFVVGVYFADSNQYFLDWYRYLIPFIDFAIVGEFEERYLFRTYFPNVVWHPRFCLTDAEGLDRLAGREEFEAEIGCRKGLIHVGRIAHRPGRDILKNLDADLVDCFGPDSKFLETPEFNRVLRKYKYGLVLTRGGVSTKFGTDQFLSNFRQSKGKVWDYIFNGVIPVTDYSPTLSELIPSSFIEIDSIIDSAEEFNIRDFDENMLDLHAIDDFIARYSCSNMIGETNRNFRRSSLGLSVNKKVWSFLISSMTLIHAPNLITRCHRIVWSCSSHSILLLTSVFFPLGVLRILNRKAKSFFR
jgi:hypothetical protein